MHLSRYLPHIQVHTVISLYTLLAFGRCQFKPSPVPLESRDCPKRRKPNCTSRLHNLSLPFRSKTCHGWGQFWRKGHIRVWHVHSPCFNASGPRIGPQYLNVFELLNDQSLLKWPTLCSHQNPKQSPCSRCFCLVSFRKFFLQESVGLSKAERFIPR